MNDDERLLDMVREVDDLLAGLSLTERTRELMRNALECKRAVEQWATEPPSAEVREALTARLTALVSDARKTAERTKGPHSQRMRIV
jgi:hypothetical protein